MTEDEVIDLLTYAASFDRRTVGDADVDAWLPVVADLSFADAREAVARHYGRDSTDWLMPKHVRDGVKAIRAERIARSVIPAPPPELCDDPLEYRRVLQEGLKQAADGHGIPATGQPPAIVGDSDRKQIPAHGDIPDLRRAIAGLRRDLPRPRPAAIPDEQRALGQAAESRATRPADESGDEGEPAA
jgi:hypothetical protein